MQYVIGTMTANVPPQDLDALVDRLMGNTGAAGAGVVVSGQELTFFVPLHLVAADRNPAFIAVDTWYMAAKRSKIQVLGMAHWYDRGVPLGGRPPAPDKPHLVFDDTSMRLVDAPPVGEARSFCAVVDGFEFADRRGFSDEQMQAVTASVQAAVGEVAVSRVEPRTGVVFRSGTGVSPDQLLTALAAAAGDGRLTSSVSAPASVAVMQPPSAKVATGRLPAFGGEASTVAIPTPVQRQPPVDVRRAAAAHEGGVPGHLGRI